jgi:hypothetical protein
VQLESKGLKMVMRFGVITAIVILAAFAAAGIRSFESVPLESVSETTANASIGDLNGDGILDIVLAKGRHWPLKDVVLFGDGKGHFTLGPPLPNAADRSYSAPLADLDKDGDLDIVLSNDSPDPKLILLNDGKGDSLSAERLATRTGPREMWLWRISTGTATPISP